MKRTFGLWIIALLVLSTAALANPVWTQASVTATATAGQATSFTAGHTVADNGSASVVLVSAPGFVTASTNGATATFQVSNAVTVGTYNFNANVTDSNSTSTVPVTLTVNPAPLMTLVAPAATSAGNNKGRASNPLADDEEDQIFRIQAGSIVLTNNGTAPITGLSASATAVSPFTSNQLNISIKDVPTTLNAGASATVSVELNIPANLDAVDPVKYKEAAFKVAEVKFTGTSNAQPVEATTAINAQRENQLEVDKVIVCVNEKCSSVKDNDKVKGIKPGDSMSIEIVAKNKYSSNNREDLDIEDVEVSYEIDDNDFSEDDSESLDNIGAGDDESETFTFDVDDDVKDGKYDLVVQAFGRDENGALHGEEIQIDLEVERENHEIELRGVSLSPSSLSCGKDTTRVNLNFANIGKRDEDEVAFEAVIDELGITERIGLFDLSEDDTGSESLALTIPADAEKKDYDVRVKSFYDTSIQSDERVVVLTVADCTAADTTTVTTQPGSTVGTGTTTTTTAQTPVVQRRTPLSSTSTDSTTTDTNTSFFDSTLGLATLAFIVVLLFGVLIVLVVKALGRKPEHEM